MSEKPQVQNIYLVRHGRPELPHGGHVYYGNSDYPLCASGLEKAKALGAALKGVRFDHIYASPLIRAVQTAEAIVPGRMDEVVKCHDLREINLGEWEGKSYDEVREQYNKIYENRGMSFAKVAPPGGENFEQLQQRTVPAFQNILDDNPTGDILFVGHGGAIWTLMCHYFKFEINDIFFYPMDYCGMHQLLRTQGMMRLLRYNWVPEIA